LVFFLPLGGEFCQVPSFFFDGVKVQDGALVLFLLFLGAFLVFPLLFAGSAAF